MMVLSPVRMIRMMGMGVLQVAMLVIVVMRMLVYISMLVVMGMIVRMGVDVRIRLIGNAPCDQHVDLGSADPAAIYFLELQLGPQAERRYALPQQLEADAGIDQGAQEHVAADAGKTF